MTSPTAGGLAELRTVTVDRELTAKLRRRVELRPVYGRSLVNHEPVAYHVAGDAGDLAAAGAVLQDALRPVDGETALRALTELALVTKSRAEDTDTEELRLSAHLARLSEYLADAVLHACRTWSDGNVFWPSWNELRELLEARVCRRRKMLDAVRQAEAEAAGTAEQLEPPACNDSDDAPRRGMRHGGRIAGELVARLAVAE